VQRLAESDADPERHENSDHDEDATPSLAPPPAQAFPARAHGVKSSAPRA
jgi:hypothetical protein